MLDYYLAPGRAAGPVEIEILDASGERVRAWSSTTKPTPVDPDTLNVPAFWRPTPASLSEAPGMHRWVWDLRGTPPPRPEGAGPGGGMGGPMGRGGPLVLPGRYTVKLTVNGKVLTQPLVVRPDPR